MEKETRQFIRDLIPPFFLGLYEMHVRKSGYSGNYASWDDARRASGGYDADVILNKVKDALLKVKRGEAVYERDSVLFDEVHYSWPLLAGLLWIASQNGNRLSVLDIGGSLGSSYFQNRRFLGHLTELRWGIVEQESFVACGKDCFEDEHLKFYYGIDDCLREQRPDALLLSSVVPYIEKPYELLDEVLDRGFGYILVDRTPLLDGEADRITVQKVPPEIYDASYPAWVLNRGKFLQRFSRDYEMVAEFDALAGTIHLGDIRAYDKGFIFRKRPESGKI